MKIRIKGTKNSVFTAFILSILAIFPVSNINADIVHHLHEVEIPVEGQGGEERALAAREALKEILVRISGRAEASMLAEDEALVPLATRFVQQFRYRKFKSDEVIPEAPEGTKPYTQKLWLLFTEKAVATLLRDQGFPVWGKTRPATLVWLVVDDQKQRILIGNSTPHISRTHIEEEATKKGLPFRLPLLDLADQSKVQVTDVWGNFEDTILAASSRYQTEAILVGRIYLSFAKTWNTRWSLYSAGQRQDWEVNNSETLRAALNEGLSKSGEVLSLRFTQVDGSQESDSVLLQVKNITDLKTFNKVIHYLKGLNAVNQIEADQVNPDNVIFRIKTRTGRLGVSQAIALGHVLISEINDPIIRDESVKDNPEQPTVELVYKLVP
ncbi:MAG: DUF2066 domain-containing protein [Gammaproteobacteria bacterium]|nr:DUF2066 domain-containing protein [Gammaproteobacteria bacterium]MCW8988752.1 DUF2066 domain-containing protein [Gammaproteobacteria bacterium]